MSFMTHNEGLPYQPTRTPFHHHACPTCLTEWACDQQPCGHMIGRRPQQRECNACWYERLGLLATPEKSKAIYG